MSPFEVRPIQAGFILCLAFAVFALASESCSNDCTMPMAPPPGDSGLKVVGDPCSEDAGECSVRLRPVECRGGLWVQTSSDCQPCVTRLVSSLPKEDAGPPPPSCGPVTVCIARNPCDCYP
jgi:hypothetical protein